MKRIEIPHNINNEKIKKIIIEKAKYFHEEIIDYYWSQNLLIIWLSSDTSLQKINFLENDIKKYILDNKNIERFLKDNSDIPEESILLQEQYRDDILSELKKLFSSIKLGQFIKNNSYNGVMMYGQDALLLRNGLNKILTDLSNKYFNSICFSTPNLLHKDIAEKSGYFNVGAQHMYFVNEIIKTTKNFSRYEQFLKGKKYQNNINQFLQSSPFVLNPAVCLHIYPYLENTNFTDDETYNSFDLIGNAYRDEGGNINNSSRFSEFCVHEIVFFGNDTVLNEIFPLVLNFMISFLDSLSILDSAIYSNDIFFGSQDKEQIINQAIKRSKIEAISHKNISLASINFHSNKFTKAFNITKNDQKICSMCLAFGIDRIINTLIESNFHIFNSDTQ